MDITKLVKDCRLAYRNCYMHHTNKPDWQKLLNSPYGIPMSDERNSSGYRNAQIRFCIEPRLEESPLFAVNDVLQVDTENEDSPDRFIGVVYVSPRLMNQDKVVRKEVLANEFLEIALAVHNPKVRKITKSITHNIGVAKAFQNKPEGVIWNSLEDEKLLLRIGRNSLLLSGESILAYFRKQSINRATYLKVLEDAAEDGPQETLLTLNKTVDELADFYSVRKDLAKSRFMEYLLCG